MAEGADAARVLAAAEAMAEAMFILDHRTGEAWLNPAASALFDPPAPATISIAHLQDQLGFYPHQVAASRDPALRVIREDLRIGGRAFRSVITRASWGEIVVLHALAAPDERQAEFAQMMSHELRTPLTSVSGAIDILLAGMAGPVEARQRRYLELARAAATRMNGLVDQLLAVARADRDGLRLTLGSVWLDRLLVEVAARYQAAAKAKGLTLRLKTDGDAVGITGDAERLAQVLGNLLANAIRFAPAHATIELALFTPPAAPDTVGLSVFNPGAPIDAAARERIFEPFSESGRRVGGTGLGLSISRTIIEAHGGQIWVEPTSPEEVGARFVISLPRHAASAASPAMASPPRPPDAPPPSGPSLTPQRILIIDADPARVIQLRALLRGDQTELAVEPDVDAALATARTWAPALALVATEVANARALISLFGHDPDTHKIAVVALAPPEASADLLAAGADAVLELPLQVDEVQDVCARAVADKRRGAARILLVDDDPGVRAVCRDILTHANYDILEAGSAAEAVAAARRRPPDLILLDVTLPDADGFETALRLRREAGAAMTPLLFLSARGDTSDKVRAFRAGAEDYIVKPFESAELLARVSKALTRHTRAVGASPTTLLPGAEDIAAEFERRLAQGAADAYACYLDLDNLKAYNDYYGYARANAIIRQVGDLIREVVARTGAADDFIGHIAGDDFVFITRAAQVDAVCTTLCRRFDELAPLYYERDDRQRGYIEADDRYGQLRRFPVMSVSIAAVALAEVSAYSELATVSAGGKRLAKEQPGSAYVRDGCVHRASP